ncbi:hypothetical protein [Kineococcus sp. SYSU DK001]|uniref:hypothetical protein n=1 Tax=Kineococcus sp. SYSU DK001 TaxID=3383122 RepID=UPI003D7D9328
MSPAAAVHVVAGAVGLLAALTALVGQWRSGVLHRVSHLVMVAAMALGPTAALGFAAPAAASLLLVVLAWVTAWAGAATTRRAGGSSPLPLDLLATSALLLLMPPVAPAGPVALSGHVHATGGDFAPVLSLTLATAWLLIAFLRCRPRTPAGAATTGGSAAVTTLPHLCTAGMAGSMLLMAAVSL